MIPKPLGYKIHTEMSTGFLWDHGKVAVSPLSDHWDTARLQQMGGIIRGFY